MSCPQVFQTSQQRQTKKPDTRSFVKLTGEPRNSHIWRKKTVNDCF